LSKRKDNVFFLNSLCEVVLRLLSIREVKMAEVVQITEANFQEMAAKYPYLILDFTATWCGPCKILDPMLKEIVANIENDKFAVGKVDVDANQGLAINFDIMNVPTLIFLKDGQPIDMQIGVSKKKDLENKVNNFIEG